MNKTILFIACIVLSACLTSCRINVLRLDNRIDRWRSMKEKKNVSIEKQAQFANKTLYFFLTNTDLQKSKESVLSDAERLRYHNILGDMQVFLIDYYASRALEAVTAKDKNWQQGELEWNKADSVSLGSVPGYDLTFKMLGIKLGYETYNSDISASGDRYYITEREFPGLMEALRKMGRFKYEQAVYLMQQGRVPEALKAYLLAFKRDLNTWTRAEKEVKLLTGYSIREIQHMRFNSERLSSALLNQRREVWGFIADPVRALREKEGDQAAGEQIYQIAGEVAANLNIAPEQALDLYYYTNSEIEGTLHTYSRQWRHEVLKGYKVAQASMGTVY